MDKCKVCGADLVNGSCPECEAKNALNKTLEGIQNKLQDSVKNEVSNLKTEMKEGFEEVKNDVEKKINLIQSVHENVQDDPKAGYKNHVEFLMDVKAAGEKNGVVSGKLEKCQNILEEKRLYNAVGSDEAKVASNPDGGFLIPDFTLPGVATTDPLAIQGNTGAFTRRIPLDGYNVKLPARVDKDHSTSVTGGFRVYREAETDQIKASKAKFEMINMEAFALTGIAYATDKLMKASPISFLSLIQTSFGEEEVAKLNYERLWGTGVGEYMGINNSPCKIERNRSTASQISGTDLVSMKMRCWGYNDAVWLANQDTELQLINAHIALSNTDLVRQYNPDTQTILRRPVIFDENCSTLGTAGDLVLVNFKEYLEGQVGTGEFMTSVHIRFDYNEEAFKTLVYNAGAPWWRTALTPKKSSNTLSPIVTLGDAS